VLQHQQQVAAAVERAKQITVQELNAIIGVRRILSAAHNTHTVCTLTLSFCLLFAPCISGPCRVECVFGQ